MSRYTALAVFSLTGLALVACGSPGTGPTAASSTTAGVTPSASPSSTPSAKGKDRLAGIIASVSGSTVAVNKSDGSSAGTVTFTPSTRISQTTTAQLTDVTAGSCVMIIPARDGGAPPAGSAITAGRVMVSPATDGHCGPAGTPNSGSSAAVPNPADGHAGVRGSVASVSGNTIVVTTTSTGNPVPTTVDVTDATRYTKRTPATAQSMTQGECIMARGSAEGSGSLQATAINLRAADDGRCPGGKGDHQGG
jgi:hypothetical protein